MAYGLKYFCQFTNELGEDWLINLSYNGYADAVTELTAGPDPLRINYINDSDDLFQPIIGCEAVLQFNIEDGLVTLEDFVTNNDNDIYCEITKEGVAVFDGWLISEEDGRQPLKDDHYLLTLRCTDGLGLLKATPLTDVDGDNFVGYNLFIDYIAGALKKANPNLTIRIYCDIYNGSMTDRGGDPTNDMFNQSTLEARSFQKDATTFFDCYEALTRIAQNNFNIFYHEGRFNILRIGDLQRALMDYTDYTIDGVATGGGTGDTQNAFIGKNERMFLINADALQGIKYANKKDRLDFNYNPWPELPTNNKFERGTLSIPLSGVGYSSYILDDWEYGKATDTGGSSSLPWTLGATSNDAYSKRSFDAFGYETARELIMTLPTTGAYAVNEEDWLRSQGFPVSAGDKISVSFQFKLSSAWASINDPIPMHVILVNDAGTDYYGLQEDSGSDIHGVWKLNEPQGIFVPNNGDNNVTYSGASCTSAPIPVDGTLYVIFAGFRTVTGGQSSIISDFQFTYMPFVAGGYLQVKGDYNQYEQTPNYKISKQEEIFISDTPKRVLQGVLSDETGASKLNPQWSRYGVSEVKTYVQLAAHAYYNLKYRKFRRIEGSVKGYEYLPDGFSVKNFGPMTKFQFSDIGDGRQFVCFNAKKDIKKGHWWGTFIEVYKDSNDGTQEDTYSFNYIFQ